MSADRDLALAIYAEIIAAHSVAEARLTWADTEDMRYTLAVVTHQAIDTVLARRVRLAARTGPWDASRRPFVPLASTNEMRSRIRELSATESDDYERAVLIVLDDLDRLLHFYAAIRGMAARTGPWDGGHHFQEEDGYPGSLLPPKRDAP